MTSPIPNVYPLPLASHDVSAAWVSAALRTRYPGVIVTEIDPLETIHGTATKMLIRLSYDASTRLDALPDRLWVKGGFAAHREYVGALGIYAGEVRFFNAIAPLYDLTRPASYFGVAQSAPVQGIVALEDLRVRHVAFARSTNPLSVDLVRSGLDSLAALHGQSWADDRPRRLGVELVMSSATEPIWTDWFEALPKYFSAARGFSAPVVLHKPERLRAAFEAYRAKAQREAMCVIHGDAHIGNAYVERDGRVGFVDWQTVALGHWAHDVNYFLVSALDVPDRRAYERDLLGYYLNALARFGVPACPIDEAWEQYRRATVYGFLCWLCNSDTWQPPEVNTATYARFGTAMLDHDTYTALGA